MFFFWSSKCIFVSFWSFVISDLCIMPLACICDLASPRLPYVFRCVTFLWASRLRNFPDRRIRWCYTQSTGLVTSWFACLSVCNVMVEEEKSPYHTAIFFLHIRSYPIPSSSFFVVLFPKYLSNYSNTYSKVNAYICVCWTA